MENNANYDFVVKDIISCLLPPKALQRQKRYLLRILCKTCNVKICESICRIDEIFEDLEKFPPFGDNKGFPCDKILELM